MATQEKLYTVDDLWVLTHLPENANQHLELIDGKVVAKMSPGQLHGIITLNIGSELRTFVKRHDLGYVAVEVGHYHPKDRHNVRLPDVSFIKKERVTELKEGFAPVMPDLAVEVKSPSNTFKELEEKAHFYLDNGVSLVWIVYPTSKTIEVYTDIEVDALTLTTADTLYGGDVLKGFTLAVKEIFDY